MGRDHGERVVHPPSGNWWDVNPSKNRCDDTTAGEISIVTSVPSVLTLNPERHNVMLNGVNCDLTYTLSPGQIDAVREALFSNRVGLTQ